LAEDEYTYQFPRWFIAWFAVFGFTAPLLFFISVGVLERSWAIAVGGGVIIILEAFLAAWLWSKVRVVMDSERICWPLKRRELRWADVETSAIVKVLGFEYVRVVMKSGTVHWISLCKPGGRELRMRLLAKLGLS